MAVWSPTGLGFQSEYANIAAELYKNQDTPGTPETGPDPAQTAATGDDVIDAEVVDQEKGA